MTVHLPERLRSCHHTVRFSACFNRLLAVGLQDLTPFFDFRANVVLACSLLKESYRITVLNGYRDEIKIVYLRADQWLLQRRLAGRHGHFMGAGLLESQLDTLEEPADALVVDASLTPDAIEAQIREILRL